MGGDFSGEATALLTHILPFAYLPCCCLWCIQTDRSVPATCLHHGDVIHACWQTPGVRSERCGMAAIERNDGRWSLINRHY